MQPRVLLDGLAMPSRPGGSTAGCGSRTGARATANDSARIREGGEVLERRTLFMLTVVRRGTMGIEDVVKTRTGQVLVVEAPKPGVGCP